jgi:hypothetical protein
MYVCKILSFFCSKMYHNMKNRIIIGTKCYKLVLIESVREQPGEVQAIIELL